jgi:hypothetical protein
LRLFEQLAKDDKWNTRVVPSSSLHRLPTIVEVTKGTGVGIGIADLLCNEKSSSTLNYGDLIAHTRRDFIQNHIAFFCGFVEETNERVFDATEILKTENTFPLALTLTDVEQTNNEITMELAKLAERIIDQSALLNDIKKLVGTQYYEGKIDRLKAEIAKAEKLAQSPTLLNIIQNVGAGAGALANLSNLSTGAVTLTSLLSSMPGDNSVLYMVAHQDQFNAAGDQLSKGAAAVGTLQQVIQKEFASFQSEIAATASRQKQQYIESIIHLSDLREAKQRVFLSVQASLDKAVIKELLGAKLVHAGPEAVQVCQLSAMGFTEMPSSTTISSLNENCNKYPARVQEFGTCLKTSPHAAGFSVLFGGNTGLLVAYDKRQTKCFSYAPMPSTASEFSQQGTERISDLETTDRTRKPAN